MASILRIANLKKDYQINNTQKQSVLKGINIEFNTGELAAIVGESGCGKTTLMNIIAGLDTDYIGSIVVNSKFLRDFTEKDMDNYRKNKVGMIFQNYNLISRLTLKENIEIAMEMSDADEKEKEERTMELLQLVGLKDHANKFPSQLSGGQKQRVAIARSLANNPAIILADEPTGALDKESSEIVMKILKKISEMGKLVIVVTHSEKVASICSRIIKLEDGIVVDDEVKRKVKLEFKKYTQKEVRNIKTKKLLQLSFNNLVSIKNRSLLVSFAMSIGIAAIILISCLSYGLTKYVTDYYDNSTSTSIIAVTRNKEAIYSEELEDIEGVYTYYETHIASYVKAKTVDKTTTITKLYTTFNNFTPVILYGKSIEENDQIIISLDSALELSSEPISIVGTTIEVNYKNKSQTFIVVGIYEAIESTSSGYITEEAMKKYFDESYFNNSAYIRIQDITYYDAVSRTLQRNGMEITSFNDESQTALDYIELGTNVLAGVAAISLFVSAILIIIVQYISVVERTQEIGILRTIGARKIDVTKMFLFEAGILGLFSGVFGALITLVISSITNIACYESLESIIISYNIWYYLLGVVISVVVCILSGIMPAIKAANLDPIESLRYE